MTSQLPAGFKLNLDSIKRNQSRHGAGNDAAKDGGDDAPPPAPMELPVNSLLGKGATMGQGRPRPGGDQRQSTTLARKNLIIQSSSDSSSDFDLESIPVGKEDSVTEAITDDVVDAPAIQVSNLPDLKVDEDIYEDEDGDGNRYGILEELLLPPDLIDEPPDQWSYRGFMKQLAKAQAAQDDYLDDDEEEDDDEEDYGDDYDDDDDESDD